MRLLALDTATEKIGYSIWDDEDGWLALCSYGTIRARAGDGGSGERLRAIRRTVRRQIKQENIDVVAVEDLVHFARGPVSKKLGQVLGVIRELAWKETKREAVLAHPSTMRSEAGKLVPKGDVMSLKKKDQKKALQLLAAKRIAGEAAAMTQDEADAILVGYVASKRI